MAQTSIGRATTVLAEADVFGDAVAIRRYGVAQSTLYNWRKKEREDAEFHELVQLKRRILLADWQQDASKCLKISLNRLAEIIQVARGEDAELIQAIANCCKVVGELKLTAEALQDEVAAED